jgi:hypothetical protein
LASMVISSSSSSSIVGVTMNTFAMFMIMVIWWRTPQGPTMIELLLHCCRMDHSSKNLCRPMLLAAMFLMLEMGCTMPPQDHLCKLTIAVQSTSSVRVLRCPGYNLRTSFS